MKISLEEVGRILRAQELPRAQDRRPSDGSVTEEAGSYIPAAVVEASPGAQEIQQIRRAVEEAPDAREELVAELKARIAADAKDFEARLALAALYASAKRWREAMDELLEIVARAKAWKDGEARKQMLALFNLAAGDAELVSEYRRKLSRLLN